MTQIINGKFVPIDITKNAMGGTELMAIGLNKRVDTSDFQIVCSRVRELDETKLRIFWAHDLPGDPASDFLVNGGWNKFHHLVFVSNWQMWAYAHHYNLPLDRCSVIPNAIEPIRKHKKPEGRINLIYYSTPHRGLELLVPAYENLQKSWGDEIHLDVYSSFSLYGWSERDEPYRAVFDRCRENPGISYHGAVDNKTIREALEKAHILAYPSIWMETSCLVLIEAMSAGLTCVHPNLAALPETSAGLTHMYTFLPDPKAHMQRFESELDDAIQTYSGPCTFLPTYAKMTHGWDVVSHQWRVLLESIRLQNPDRALPRTDDLFTIRIP